MIAIDLSGMSAVVTGGTRGIGHAVGLELTRAGARCYVTHRWGSVEYDALARIYEEEGLAPPTVVEADVSQDDDTDALLRRVAEDHGQLDILVANAGLAQRVTDLESYSKRSFFRTLEYSAWPLIAYAQRAADVFGTPPRRIVAISSSGPDEFYRGYDYVAASKALLEVLARYLAIHAFDAGARVNVLRCGVVPTESFDAFFGLEFFEFARASGIPDDMMLDPAEIGRAVVALCSDLLAGLNGQILTLDKGLSLRANPLMQYLAGREAVATGDFSTPSPTPRSQP